jgi:peptide/nickel transport system substrate-binding protein
MRKSRLTRLLACVFAIGLVAAACGDSDEDSSTTTGGSTETGSTTTAAKTPVKGGTIIFGQFSREGGLDPIKLAGGGTVGGNEAAAIFDVLLRYNPETAKYEGQLAESITPNADFTEWTLKLRPNLKFADGTPIDAANTKWVIEREMAEGNSSPKGQLTAAIKQIDVIDPTTVKFTGKFGWVGFPYLFVGVGGFTYSRAAVEKLGKDAFNLDPSSGAAGPFRVKSYKPGDSLDLERNPNYWGGADKVNLDGIKFVLISGAQPTLDAVKTGTLQAGFLRDPVANVAAKDAGLKILRMPLVAGNIINMNSGVKVTCAGASTAAVPSCQGIADGTTVTTKTATGNLNVRKAVVAAVDPKVINDRVWQGKGVADSAPFANFPWDPKVTGPKADVNEAKRLVALAKTEGWDGKIRLLSANTPEGQTWGEAVASQLEAAGMVVERSFSQDTNAVVSKVLVQRDYDLATWAYGLLDESDNNYNQLNGTFAAGGRYGFSSPEILAGIDGLRLADTDAKRTEAYKKISEAWIAGAPAHVLVNYDQTIASTQKLNGLVRTGSSIVLFDKAWLEK